MRINTKEEFISEVANRPKIKCAIIEYEYDIMEKRERYVLKVNHSPEEYRKFLDSLDFTYFSGHGLQELFGTIWYIDGSWSERYEYDGAERWVTKFTPRIPNDLK